VPLARLAIIGGKTLMDRDGGLILDTGLASVIGDLARFKAEPAVPTVVSTASGEWISAAEAAVLADCSWQHILRLCRQGRLIARRGQYRWEVDRESAESYARSRSVA
jgi:hypothetical protein